MNYQFLHKCKICGHSEISVVKVPLKKLILICDECEAVWDSPKNFIDGDTPQKLEAEVIEENVNFDEIIELGWAEYFIKYDRNS